MTDNRLARLAANLRTWVEAFDAEKAVFVSRLETNPTRALEQSTTLMFLSTRADAAKRLLDAIERQNGKEADTLLKGITEVYQREALNIARAPRRSTNPVSDYIAAEHGRTAVEVLDLVQFA